MEVASLLPVGAKPLGPPPVDPAPHRAASPPPAWRGGTEAPVQGGGLRLENLGRTLPGNLVLLEVAYGRVLLGLAAWGALLSLVRRRRLVLAAVPYGLAALLFFSCWTRPDQRYLAGIHLFVPMLVVEGAFGTLDVLRGLALGRRPGLARLLAVVAAGALLAAAALGPAPPGRATALPVLAVLIPGAAGAAAVAAAAWPRRRLAGWLGPSLALALVGLGAAHGIGAAEARAAFQRPEMLAARATLARSVAPRGVVITTEEVGRPAENIDHYSEVVHALYLTDLERWRLPLADAALALERRGMPPYLLIPRGAAGMLRALEPVLSAELVADVPAEDAIRYFVVEPFGRRFPMQLWRLAGKRGGASEPGGAGWDDPSPPARRRGRAQPSRKAPEGDPPHSSVTGPQVVAGIRVHGG
jgi:hypothetical protein